VYKVWYIGDPIRDERTARSRLHASAITEPEVRCVLPRRAGSVIRLRFAAFSRGQLFHGASHGRNGRPDRIQESTLQFSPVPAAAEQQVRCLTSARANGHFRLIARAKRSC